MLAVITFVVMHEIKHANMLFVTITICFLLNLAVEPSFLCDSGDSCDSCDNCDND